MTRPNTEDCNFSSHNTDYTNQLRKMTAMSSITIIVYHTLSPHNHHLVNVHSQDTCITKGSLCETNLSYPQPTQDFR